MKIFFYSKNVCFEKKIISQNLFLNRRNRKIFLIHLNILLFGQRIIFILLKLNYFPFAVYLFIYP